MIHILFGNGIRQNKTEANSINNKGNSAFISLKLKKEIAKNIMIISMKIFVDEFKTLL